MQSEKCKSCFECTETVIVKVRDDRNSEWRDSSVRRCANDQCWHIVDGTREDRLTWISNVYDYKYFGDYELSPEQLAAVYEAKSLAAALSTAEPVAFTSQGQIAAARNGSTALLYGKRDEFMNVPLYAAPPAPSVAVKLEKRPAAFEVLDAENGTYLVRSERAAVNSECEYNGLYRRDASALSAQVQDVAKGWHVASNSGSVLVYCLKQDGWRKGEPVMVNDIMIRVENANRSSNELQPIVDAIMRALPAAPAKQEGGE